MGVIPRKAMGDANLKGRARRPIKSEQLPLELFFAPNESGNQDQ